MRDYPLTNSHLNAWHHDVLVASCEVCPPAQPSYSSCERREFHVEVTGAIWIQIKRKLQYQYWIWWHLVEVFRSLVFFAPKFLSAGTPINLDFCGLLRLHGLCQHSWCSTCSGKIIDVHHVCLFPRLINWLTRSLCKILAYVCVVTNQTLLYCVAYDSA